VSGVAGRTASSSEWSGCEGLRDLRGGCKVSCDSRRADVAEAVLSSFRFLLEGGVMTVAAAASPDDEASRPGVEMCESAGSGRGRGGSRR
jgi:hypothetical protein